MFTGIVETMGRIRGITPTASGVRLNVDAGDWKPRSGAFQHGDSVCVSGICLTLVEQTGTNLAFDVIVETLRLTRLGDLAVGHRVNLESSLTATTPMGGHIVQGHCDGLGQVIGVARGADWRITIRPPAALMDYIVQKGSVAVDGVSLTVAAVTADAFDVALIPTTLSATTLSQVTEGGALHIETDIVSRTVAHWLSRRGQTGGGVTMATLRGAGMVE